VETLDALAADPGIIANLPLEVLTVLYEQAEVLAARLRSAMLSRASQGRQEAPRSSRMLTTAEVAQLLRKSVSWVEHQSRRLPFWVSPGRYSEAGLEDYIRKQTRARK
jgi:hypothetical protein